jgi:hypothetical protein
VMHIGIICDDVFRTKIVINSVFIFTKVIFTAVILLVLLQNHVCHRLSAPGPLEDRRRAECFPNQNHGPQCPR